MSGETEREVSGWTVDTLKELFQTQLAAADERYEQRFKAAEQAVLKAEVASEKRFDGVNEFRAALADQTGNLMPRPEAEARLNVLSEKLNDLGTEMRSGLATLREAQTNVQGRDHGIGQSWTVLVGVFVIGGIAVDILSRVIHP